MKASTYNPKYALEYRALLDRCNNGDTTVNESTMQKFLEEHTTFIPTPFMLNHQLHFNCFISKFPIGTSWKSDIAFLTKSTVEWYLVLLELENPHRKLFKGSIGHAEFTSDYTHAKEQIRDWKVYISDHHQEVVDSLKRIRQPLAWNKVSVKYAIVMGRRSEIEHSDARRRAIAEENRDDFKIITYDTLLSDYERARRISDESLVLSLYNTDRFKAKYLPESGVRTPLFSYMGCEDVSFTDEQIERLRAENYEIDSWLKGELLTINNQYTDKGFAERQPEGSFMRALFEERAEKNLRYKGICK